MKPERCALENIAIIGIGRMGKGIALAFAYAGYPVDLVDSEERPAPAFDALAALTRDEIRAELRFLEDIGVITASDATTIGERIRTVGRAEAAGAVGAADFVFEAVVELLEIKQRVYGWLDGIVRDDAILSSTTSTMATNDLARFIRGPERFVNGHWLNPAHLMPLVEVSPGDHSSPGAVAGLRSLLERIGKAPVVCKPSPGFIVPRIQAVAMNEAARLVEEGIASAEDVDRAVRAGFGIRFATLGLLEFIDWGGGDILYHASNYLRQRIDPHRFSIPAIVADNMAAGRNGLRDGIGFYDWSGRDIDAYRREKLSEFVRLLQHRDLMPRPGIALEANSLPES